ncbi:MAG: pyruvate dehydrogenase (acetyl-transferring) E1 component subunit alpha [Betaproteobacteria bacterium RBG_16_64_9]|nr:MAG: pyruvate dehydrogenase (acetyl-transferring) E1 component subunit alpha [Betaproteobacteria bacterium RBG_16_64_9]OGA25837.1 MAG: pyruvate dehydrogenase (acetyl-transferring) E1 component subunit alpha [Betaproteobacteria bacterium RIFCSPLOWO2_02_FULL_65_24]OGA77279.1 MAG: pyruvate dehydrogenase (acetyl-transferring) E1 component subunit alpha [Betaproteobacteria bacterium RIFCSPLOWO2_12_FULL_66_14]
MVTVATFHVEYSRYLSPDGVAHEPLPEFARNPEHLVRLYRAMVLTRVFDTKAIALQRTGKLGTFASSLGQEAVSVGMADAMRPEDVLVPYYRDHGAQFVRGVSMAQPLLYWGGDERGSDFPAARKDFPNCVPIGTQVCHAAGVAYAMRVRREARVAVCSLGDGSTSKGDFYEGMNLAGAFGLPVVLVVVNNQWAISVPRSAQTRAATLAQKALAAGIEGLQVDGNDVIAVRDGVARAIDKARAGGGPTLIEALTYRLGDHTTADDASRYRDAGELREHWKLEPIARLRQYLAQSGAWDKQREEQLLQECTAQVNRSVEEYLAMPFPSTETMFDHLYEQLPESLRPQRETALRFAPANGAPHG